MASPQALSGLQLGAEPIRTTCPHCHQNILTSIEIQTDMKTHLIALLLCLFGCWPCVCIPYCMDSCKGKKHSCPGCHTHLGTFSKII